MIRLTEEPYDSEVAGRLVAALTADINERYADETDPWTPEEEAADIAAYLAEVDPVVVRPPLGTFVVAWLEGEAVGCGAVKLTDPADDLGEVKRMYTVPEARRQGVAAAILVHLEARAAALGIRRLRLETGTAQPEALALYESHGWARITPYGRYRDEPSSVCFGKSIGDP